MRGSVQASMQERKRQETIPPSLPPSLPPTHLMQQIRMTQHHALGVVGCPARVNQRGHRADIAGDSPKGQAAGDGGSEELVVGQNLRWGGHVGQGWREGGGREGGREGGV
jgi:hypothetical protein